MKACRDCKHVFDGPMNNGKPACGHPKGFNELEDFYNGRMYTAATPVNFMRRLGGCGPEAELFEPRD